MKLHFKREVITAEGMTQIEYTFDTNTLELHFDPKFLPLMKQLYLKEAQDIPETEQVDVIEN